MPRSKLSAGLASLIESDSDSEPDFDSFDAVGAEDLREGARVTSGANTARRGRPSANRITKPAQRSTQNKRGGAIARTKAAATRAPEASDETIVESPAKPRGRTKASKASETVESLQNGSKTKGRRGRPPKDRANEVVESQTPEKSDMPQSDPMELDELEDEVPPSIKSAPRRANRQPLDRGEHDDGDDSLRRQLEDMRRKYESLEARHNELKEAVVKEAERNFDRLKKKAEETNASANKLIAQLKAELATQTKLAEQGRETEHELELSEANRTELESQISNLNTALVEAKTEAKSLSVKLTAARNADMKVPGSALKNKAASTAGINADVVKIAQAKEDLYGDLTGLIVRGLQRDGDEDIFDCIQTGRNGTLHFKLALDPLEEVDNYEDVQYTYRPQLDPQRDEALMEVLPDYLVEEITFPRTHASKFYTRVTKSLTERLE